ncbi:putative harbinger transposase-derived protein [Helianthus annuus]|nr:putative harbinger transposase-derived protein [Helianthus annuus]
MRDYFVEEPVFNEEVFRHRFCMSKRLFLKIVRDVQHVAARKDVERAFGVLKAKWGVLNRPMRAMSVKKIRSVVYACIIMHNMILKDDGNAIAPVHIRDPPVEPVFEDTAYNELIDEDTHYRLKYDLVKHLGKQYLPHLLADSDDE